MIAIPKDFVTEFASHADLILMMHLLNMCDDDGEVNTTIDKLVTTTSLSTKVVRNSIERLIKGQHLGKKRAEKITTLTICRYGSYANTKSVKGQQKGNKRAEKRATTIDPSDTKEAKFQARMDAVYPNVAKMKEQLTLAKYNQLLKLYTNEDIMDVLKAMDNTVGLHRKYINAGLTLENWLKRRNG